MPLLLSPPVPQYRNQSDISRHVHSAVEVAEGPSWCEQHIVLERRGSGLHSRGDDTDAARVGVAAGNSRVKSAKYFTGLQVCCSDAAGASAVGLVAAVSMTLPSPLRLRVLLGEVLNNPATRYTIASCFGGRGEDLKLPMLSSAISIVLARARCTTVC